MNIIKKLQEAVVQPDVNEVTSGKQGGLSKEVYMNPELQDYISGGDPAGYIGSYARTMERDKILEEALRATGLENAGIAIWLTSGHGRHLMDSVSKETTADEFRQIVLRNTADAFKNVTIWSHPDHKGSLASTRELEEKIKKAFR